MFVWLSTARVYRPLMSSLISPMMTSRIFVRMFAIPGGLIKDPNAAAGDGALVPNHGVTLVGHVFEKRLRQLFYYCFHLHYIQHEFVPGQATLQHLSQCWKLKEEEDEVEDVPDLEPLTNITKVHQSLENIDDALGCKRGAYGIPLTYVVDKMCNFIHNSMES
jgi:hypothetical protein